MAAEPYLSITPLAGIVNCIWLPFCIDRSETIRTLMLVKQRLRLARGAIRDIIEV